MSASPRKPALTAEVRAYFAALARAGGDARARKLTAAQRRESAKKAAAARWSKTTRAKKKRATK